MSDAIPYDLLAITVTTFDLVTVLKLGGELDLYSARLLREVAHGLAAAGDCRIVLDLAGLGFCDAAGLGALVGCQSRIRASGGRLSLAGVSPKIARLFAAARLGAAFEIFPCVADALCDAQLVDIAEALG